MTNVAKAERPRTGTIDRRVDAAGRAYHYAKVTLGDGSRHVERVPATDTPKFVAWCKVNGLGGVPDAREARARAFAEWLQVCEDATGAFLDAKVARAAARAAAKERATTPVETASEGSGETCDQFYTRFLATQRERGRGSTSDMLSAWRAWVSPRIGHRPIREITQADIEDLRDALDNAIRIQAEHGTKPRVSISPKRATNIWGGVTIVFREASSSKRRELRVRLGLPNPCRDVEGPGERGSRTQARARQFIYPSEAAALFACEAVPLEWREAHAVAAMTYLRPGELRALRWGDVDLTHGNIHVARAFDSRAKKDKRPEVDKTPKTRSGVRVVPIHASLLPLLQRMHADATKRRGGTDVSGDPVVPLLSSPEHGAMARNDWAAKRTRAHLKAAGVTRPALFRSTRTDVMANWRTWRDSGITWAQLAGVDIVKTQRRAGHANVSQTNAYTKAAEAVAGQPLGVPFASLPDSLVNPGVNRPSDVRLPFEIVAERAGFETESSDGERQISRVFESETQDRDSASARTYDQPRQLTRPFDGPDAESVALAKALEAATEAKRWDLVGQLAAELQARRTATEPRPLARVAPAEPLEDAKRG